jgi:acylphosphatase
VELAPQPLRLRALVLGHVQGVGFRWFVVRQAEGLGLAGWTRNGADGLSVEVVAEGERSRLEELLRRITAGIPRSRVDRVEATWEETTGEFSSFTIRY